MNKYFYIFIFLFGFNSLLAQSFKDTSLEFDCSTWRDCEILDSIIKNKTHIRFAFITHMTDNLDSLLTLPPNFYKLKNLEVLYLHGNFALLSRELKNLKNLRKIHIVANSNILPPEVKYLRRLKQIEIYGIDTVLPQFCELDSLEYLTLAGNFNSLPDCIGNLKSLKKLYLVSPNLKDLPKSISNLKKLKILILEHTQIKKIPRRVCKLKNLEYLDISGSKIKKIPGCITKLPKLRELSISACLTNKQRKRIEYILTKKSIQANISKCQ